MPTSTAFKQKFLSEYVLDIAGPTRQLIDASNEDCPLYEGNVCLDPLANHAT